MTGKRAARLKSVLEDKARNRHIPLYELVKDAYSRLGIVADNPYDTVKKWFRKEPLRVRFDRFEAVMGAAGCAVAEYPHLPAGERERLTKGMLRLHASEIQAFLSHFEIIDLSHEIKSAPSCGFLPDPPQAATELTQGESHGIIFNTTIIQNFSTNYGTHIDFPGHIASVKSQPTVSSYPLSHFIAEAVILDIRDVTTTITRRLDAKNRVPLDAFGKGSEGVKSLVEAIEQLEISKDTFLDRCDLPLTGKGVLFCTGLDRYWVHAIQSGWRYGYFLNPFLSAQLAEHLRDQKVLFVGSDSLQLECPLFNISSYEDFGLNPQLQAEIDTRIARYLKQPIHQILLESGICLVENLRGLDLLLPGPVLFCAAPLELAYQRASDNSPTRAFAFVPRRESRSERSIPE